LFVWLLIHAGTSAHASAQDAAELPASEVIAEEVEAAKEAVYSREWQLAEETVSALFSQRRSHPEFLEIVDEVTASLSHLSPGALREELQGLRARLAGTTGSGWLMAAALARSLDKSGDADACLMEALKEPSLGDNPFLHVLRAEALLEIELEDDAVREFDEAVALGEAWGERDALFYVKVRVVNSLYEAGKVAQAVERARRLLTSDFPPERAWALAQAIKYYWHLGERESAERAHKELNELLPALTPRPGLSWRSRRIEQAWQAAAWYTGMLAGDPLMELILDEDATDFDLKKGDFEVAAGKLRVWVERYPIEDFARWSDELKKWGAWVNYTYCGTLLLAGRSAEAEAALRRFVREVPFEGSQKQLVAQSWCSLGSALHRLERFPEAREAYERGLRLDAQDATAASLPSDLTQPSVQNGHMHAAHRKAYIEGYRRLPEVEGR
jgi:tetratricopeptide (TPR) repeat protein